jgi:hypothetical protein
LTVPGRALRYPRIMNEQPELVTVFRSLDATADEQAESIRMLLAEAGLSPVVLDDHAPGVVEGTWEVRVPPEQAAQAERLMAAQGAEELKTIDDSDALDLETVFHSEGSSIAEMEATEIQTLLAAEGIDAVIVGTPMMPNLAFEVRVPRGDVQHALELIEDAQASGPAAADAAEQASEEAGGAPSQ